MVTHPGAYPWSSYRVNVGLQDDPLVKEHEVYRALASAPWDRHAAYRALCNEEIDAEGLKTVRAATHGGYPLASDGFKSRLQSRAGLRLERGKPGPRGRVSNNRVVDNRADNCDPDSELAKLL